MGLRECLICARYILSLSYVLSTKKVIFVYAEKHFSPTQGIVIIYVYYINDTEKTRNIDGDQQILG